ncbi:MAG: hypothetical protein WCR85_00040 [Sphaerochaeta sp.]
MVSTFGIGYIQDYHEASVDQARQAIQTLDGVDIIPLYRENEGNYEQTKNIYGVVNTGTNKVTMPVSHRYKPLSHIGGFGPALDAIESADIDREMMLNIENHGDTAELYVLFPEMMFNEDKEGGGMMYGLRFRNQYDQKTSFRGHVFCWRVQCLNGSTHARLGEMIISARHVDSHIQSLSEKIHTFVEHMVANAGQVETVVDAAIESPVNFSDYDEIVRTLTGTVTGGERHSKDIAPAIPLETNRWQIFNAITDYASHSNRVSWKTRDRLLDNAERNILMAGTVSPIVDPIEV